MRIEDLDLFHMVRVEYKGGSFHIEKIPLFITLRLYESASKVNQIRKDDEIKNYFLKYIIYPLNEELREKKLSSLEVVQIILSLYNILDPEPEKQSKQEEGKEDKSTVKLERILLYINYKLSIPIHELKTRYSMDEVFRLFSEINELQSYEVPDRDGNYKPLKEFFFDKEALSSHEVAERIRNGGSLFS